MKRPLALYVQEQDNIDNNRSHTMQEKIAVHYLPSSLKGKQNAMAKTIAVPNANADYIRKVATAAIQSDPEVVSVFRASDLGFKSGAGLFIVTMSDGSRFRCNLSITPVTDEH